MERITTTQVGTRNIKLGRKNNSRAVDGEWNGIYNIKKKSIIFVINFNPQASHNIRLWNNLADYVWKK